MQCENQDLKSLIQQLLALEKFVNSIQKNKNATNSQAKKECSNGTTVKKPGVKCTPNLYAIVPVHVFQLTNTKPAQNAPQGTGVAQAQTPKQGQSVNQGQAASQSQAPKPTGASISGTPTSSAVNKPTGTVPPTASVQRPVATPPPPPFFITLQGVTTYDTPMAVLPQSRGVPYVRQPYKAVPANWVTSGTGPIDLKVSIARLVPFFLTIVFHFLSFIAI